MEIMKNLDDLFLVNIPIKQIYEDSDNIVVLAQGRWKNEKVSINFSFKKSLQPFYNIITGEGNTFLNTTNNPKAYWIDNGSEFLMPNEEGLSFVNFLLDVIGEDPSFSPKTHIVFNTCLLSKSLTNHNFPIFFQNNVDSDINLNHDEAALILEQGKPIPNFIYLKLEHLLDINTLERIQLLLSVDIDKGCLIISEKDLDMRSNVRAAFEDILVIENDANYQFEDDKVKIVALLLEKGSNLKPTKTYVETELHVAAWIGNVELANLVLKKGADIEAKNEYLDTPLHHACRKGCTEIVDLLLKKGANIEAINRDGETPLHRASRNRHLKIVEMLLIRNANANAVNYFGDTPLMQAFYGDPEDL
jgi:hypothetical protein